MCMLYAIFLRHMERVAETSALLVCMWMLLLGSRVVPILGMFDSRRVESEPKSGLPCELPCVVDSLDNYYIGTILCLCPPRSFRGGKLDAEQRPILSRRRRSSIQRLKGWRQNISRGVIRWFSLRPRIQDPVEFRSLCFGRSRRSPFPNIETRLGCVHSTYQSRLAPELRFSYGTGSSHLYSRRNLLFVFRDSSLMSIAAEAKVRKE